MNKKFSTLLASFLLAGGAFSNVWASEWPTDTQYVLNTGKYHLIEQVADFDGTNWSTINNNYYLSLDASGSPIFTQTESTSAYWTITTKVVAGITYYQLTNADGKVLTYKHNAGTTNEKKIDWFIVESATSPLTFNDLSFMDGATKNYIDVGSLIPSTTDYEVTANPSTTGACGFDNTEITEKAITADVLNAELTKNAFGLIIGSAKDKEYTDLQGNVFTGEIEAKEAVTPGTYYFYRKADKKYIVLTEKVWSKRTDNLDGVERSAYAGYKFEAISEHAFGTLTAAERVAQAEFQVFKSYDFNDTDSLIVTLPNAKVGDMPAAWTGDVNSANANQDKGVRLYVANVADVNYLTVIEYAKANDRLATQHDDAYASYQVGASVPYVKLGKNNIVDFAKTFAGKVWNITNTEGKILSPNVDWANVDLFYEGFTPAEQVQLNKPEGHWLPYYTDATNYGFVNRESGIEWNIQDGWVIRSTATPNLYEIYTSKYWTTASQEYKVYITEAQNAELGKTENGYAKFDEAKEALDGKYLTLTSGITGESVYVGKDADDNVILTKEKAEAIEFRIKDMKHDYTSHDGLAGIDTLQHYTNYLGFDKDGNLVTKTDTVQFYHYRLFETFSEKYLTYNSSLQKFELEGYYSTDDNAHEDFNKYLTKYGTNYSAFVLKEKNGKYNLVSDYYVAFDYCNVTGSNHTPAANAEFDNDFNADLYGKRVDNNLYPARKMYGAFQTATLANMSYIYNYNDNDRFAIENVGAPEYMTITGAQDTVKIALKAQPNFYLYEQGTFLGMEHVADADMKAAILVDTAYVRNNTYRPQYLLGVGTSIHSEEFCNRPDIHPSLHKDTVYGRFLINAVDSAAAWKGTDKTNPYIWEKLGSNKYYRLVFVDGFHTADALTLHTDKGDKKIALGNNNDKVCTFAFRYVDEARESVKIETLYGVTNNGTPIRGWLKYQNNVPVVTCDYEDAHVFTVDNEVEEAPTANEGVEVSEVSVVATNGAVIVKGAAGKTVAISNILGQTIANTVVASDNATIAVPAGIVVVAVEGEEAVKVVVK